MSDPLWINAGKASTSVGTATIEADDDLCTLAAHGLADGDTVTVDTLTGGAVGVLVADAVYFVVNATTNTFGLSLTRNGALVAFAADGGADVYRWAPGYTAAELRRLTSGLLQPGSAHRFGARPGLFPHGGTGSHVTLVGSTWTTADLRGVAYPGVTSQSGPYLFAHPSQSASLNPADATNPRIDALDLQIHDNDEDLSGFRRAHVVYVAGVPAATPVEPPLSANSFRLQTFNVPQQGGGSPTLLTGPPFTASAGGIIPVRNASEYPQAGERFIGLALWDIALQALLFNQDGSSGWRVVASADTYQPVRPKYKLSNEVVVSSTALQDDNDLWVDIPEVGNWIVEACIFWDSSTAADWKSRWTYSGTFGTNRFQAWSTRDPSTGSDQRTDYGMDVDLAIQGAGAGDVMQMICLGGFQATGTGTFRLRWAQNSSNASNTIVRSGSWLKVTKAA